MALMSLTQEVANLKTVTAGLRPDTCTIQRNTPTSDGAAGSIDSWSDLATNVSCRVTPVSKLRAGSESLIAAKLTSIEPRIIMLPPNQDLQVADRVIYSGKTYEVKSVDESVSYEIHVRAYLDLVQ